MLTSTGNSRKQCARLLTFQLPITPSLRLCCSSLSFQRRGLAQAAAGHRSALVVASLHSCTSAALLEHILTSRCLGSLDALEGGGGASVDGINLLLSPLTRLWAFLVKGPQPRQAPLPTALRILQVLSAPCQAAHGAPPKATSCHRTSTPLTHPTSESAPWMLLPLFCLPVVSPFAMPAAIRC